MIGRIIKLGFVPKSYDVSLLVLRILAGLDLFIKHGYEKIFTFGQMAPTFSDPIHIGSTNSLIMAMISDSICSILIVFGLATRWACFYSFCVIFVAWSLRFHFLYLGPRMTGDHGELSVLLLICWVVIFIAGPGRYSMDALLKD